MNAKHEDHDGDHDTPPTFQYRHLDPEARLGLPPGRGTTPGLISSLVLTCLMAGSFYGLAFVLQGTLVGRWVWTEFTSYQFIPVPIVFLSSWCLAFLLVKSLKIRVQGRVLRAHLVPGETLYVLGPSTAGALIHRVDALADDPSRFLYFARVRAVLGMTRNLGRVGDLEELFALRADQDESSTDSGYTILKGIVWAIPVLGFIGTVLGLTTAMGQFGATLTNFTPSAEGTSNQIGGLVQDLTGVLGGLETAFVTTGQALIAVLFLQIVATFVRRSDEQLMDDMRDACSRRVVARVRLAGD